MINLIQQSDRKIIQVTQSPPKVVEIRQSSGRGPAGQDGNDGREVEFNDSGTHIQWRYVGETVWIDLVELALLKGDTGDKGDKGDQGDKGDKGDKGDTGDNGGDGEDGKEVEFNKSSTHIQWRYVGDTTWINLVALTDIKGDQGDPGNDGQDAAQIEIQNSGTNIEWRRMGEPTWNVIVSIAAITGADGSDGTNGTDGTDGNDGREVQIQNSGTHIQWRYVGDAEWTNVIDIASITGADGSDGTDGDDGREVEIQNNGTHVQWRYVGDPSWTNLIELALISGLDGTDGADGSDGTNGTDGDNGWSPVFAVVTDSARRVLQVSDWQGGSGTKPTAGLYVGATGLEANIANGVDIRGATGADGAGSGDMSKSTYDTNDDGKVNAADTADSVPWSGVSSKPSTFPPEAHNHDDRYYTETEINSLLDGKSDVGHNHDWSSITDKPTTFAPSAHSHAWSEITDKPTTFTPSTHTHLWADITDKPSTFAPSSHTHLWADITDKPSTFTPSSHNHAGEDITSGTVAAARLGSGTDITTKFLRGDNTWQVVSGGGGGSIESGGTFPTDPDIDALFYYTGDEFPNGLYQYFDDGDSEQWVQLSGRIFSEGGAVDWADITGKPSTFTPSSHTHTKSQITDLQAVESTTIANIVTISQAAYNALSPPVSTTLYVITS
jgi:hypothetical protein